MAKEERGGGITKTGKKKTIWFHEDEAEALRVAAFERRQPESEIIREATSRVSGMATLLPRT